MENLVSTRLAAVVGGEHHGPEVPVGPDVVIDSRQTAAGALFVALPGERTDGHAFVAAAAEAGAAAALVTRVVEAEITQIVVEDAVAALSALGRHVVEHSQTTRLALTGSSGKTSTKDLLAQVLADAAPTVAPVGSFNNEIGVPLTACRVDDDTRFLISEMGARGQGHVAWLCSLTHPQIAAVLNIGTAHLGEFGSVEAIATAKSEIVQALPADGWAVLNADDPHTAAMTEATEARVCWFSTGAPVVPLAGAGRSVVASQIVTDDLQRPRFVLTFAEGDVVVHHAVSLALLGRHMVANAAAAAALAWCAGVAPDAIAASLTAAEHRSHWRMELTERADGAAVLNDAYNANPDSMRAALETFGEIVAARRRQHPDARAVAVLGDMLELGDDSDALHRRAGEQAVAAGVDEVLALGEEADQIVAGVLAAGGTGRVATVDEASSLHLGTHDVALVKASRGLGLERVASALLAAAEAGSTGGEL